MRGQFSAIKNITGPTMAQTNSNLQCDQNSSEIIISNSKLTARFSRPLGELTIKRAGATDTDPAAISGERLRLHYPPLTAVVSEVELENPEATLEKCYSFYARVSVTGVLPQTSGQFKIQRTYEFTRGTNIYEQIAVIPENSLVPPLPRSHLHSSSSLGGSTSTPPTASGPTPPRTICWFRSPTAHWEASATICPERGPGLPYSAHRAPRTLAALAGSASSSPGQN